MSDDNKLRNFLVNGFQGLERPKDDNEEAEDIYLEEEPLDGPVETEYVPEEPVYEEEPVAADSGILTDIDSKLSAIRDMLEDIRDSTPDLTPYMTTRESNKALNTTISRMETAAANKSLLRAMEQISTMREDFFRLCEGMRARIDEMDAETVLSSFEAYRVDMENILTDANVYIGKFEFDKLNTLHQRIVGVVPTDEKEKDGTIAERQSDGYKLGDKVLLKERVTVYKYDPGITEEDAQVENDSETASETICSKADGESEDGTASREEKE